MTLRIVASTSATIDARVSKDPEYLSTLDRGLQVLRAFDREHAEMSLSMVAARTGLSVAVARRCLNTLVALGYVAQDQRIFRLRHSVLVFGSAFLSSSNVEAVATPHLQALRDETGDSASFAILSDQDIFYLAHASTRRQLRIEASVGTRFPAYATSLGKVLLAFQPDERLQRYLHGSPRRKLTVHTLTEESALRERLAIARSCQYETSIDELDYGVASIAVPVLYRGRAVAAINCSTATTRVSVKQLIETRLPLLRSAADALATTIRDMPALLRFLQEE